MPRDGRITLAGLDAAVDGCRQCDLWRDATQGVAGMGPPNARMILVGEQPGDQEDKAGEPFVGPAGRILDDALGEVGLDRRELYVTNAVKHFKWEARGKRRIHQRPNRTQVVACHDWLELELAALPSTSPVVALGAIAGQSLLGPSFKVGESRGKKLVLDGRILVATIHPSAVLRARGGEERTAMFDGFVADLRQAASLVS